MFRLTARGVLSSFFFWAAPGRVSVEDGYDSVDTQAVPMPNRSTTPLALASQYGGTRSVLHDTPGDAAGEGDAAVKQAPAGAGAEDAGGTGLTRKTSHYGGFDS